MPAANEDATNAAIYLRGLFVHRFSGVEFAISELLTRARLLPEYSTLEDLPFKWASKLRMAHELLDMPGPLQPHRFALLPLLDDLPAFEVYRHLMVHGLMSVQATEGAPIIKLRSYDHVKGLGLGAAILDMPFEEFEHLCDQLKEISYGVTGTVARICRETPLPLLSSDPLILHPNISPV